ncbi:uncharacterized protein TRIADDRAFT_33800 [Trichoplax adhaerens]|uniref:C2 domain-containing protein n=1 Tax=Trichoplax adhaerens TaxID=10228 RepID=B3SD97_TRIAD|nr:hypothetical protein TRIADDRAFT_33800 [Trichoplax adhaerens]EDV19303.1 hypothetical protein TRIADDRAFT_33800 [Trichoplax adhaerens]|eukprot:XP_002118227.1 hypothetical protein TRIADDRAFT_33800 [Trichoplax adhaerens]
MASPRETVDSSVPASQVSLHISCRKLVNKDLLSKSDPMVVVYQQDENGYYKEFGRTECIKDNLNPKFIKSFTMTYFFEELQMIRFHVYDIDGNSSNLDKHDFLGRMECSLAEIMSHGGILEKPLTCIIITLSSYVIEALKPRKIVLLQVISAEEINPCNDIITFHFHGKNLDKKDLFGKSDPFLVFYRKGSDGSFVAVHKTEVIKRTLNPKWKEFKIPARLLCNGDYYREVKIECYDWDRDGGHDLIGEVYFVLQEVRHQVLPASFECINPKKKLKKKKYTNSGMLVMLKMEILEQGTYIDYIRGGLQIEFNIGIDFTASNGDPSKPDSLHYNSPRQQNQYLKALIAVGKVCQEYDSDKRFPAYGFGGKLPSGEISHEFHLNGDPNNPECVTMDSVVQAYSHSLNTVQLYGPTNFAPIIKRVARYSILLMLTDGRISDLAATKRVIVEASHLPLSIIIVGVGNADFTGMEVLDGDETRLSSGGREAVRDIFVPFSDFLVNGTLTQLSAVKLAREVLAEIPDQILSYMAMNRIKPNPSPPSYQFLASLPDTANQVKSSAPLYKK